MYKKTALLATLLLATAAHAVDTPDGWQTRRDNLMTHYTPDNIGDRIFMVSVLDPLPDDGKDEVAWLTMMADKLAPNYGEVLQRGEAGAGRGIATAIYRVSIAGKPVTIIFTAVPAGVGNMRLIQLLSEEDPALLRDHMDTVKRLISAYYAEGDSAETSAAATAQAAEKPAVKPAATTQGGPKPVTSNSKESDALLAGLKRDNMTIGGALTYGDYDCAVQMDKGMKYTLSLYDNGQYRITGDGSSDGEYQYSPSGYINVNDDVFLYNHTSTFGHGVRELAFYFTDHGKPGLYGQNIANNIIVVCAYSGAAKGPSPAQEAVDRAEAARFKWVTAPGQGVQDKDIETLLFHGEAEYFGTDITFVEAQYLLLKDGWAYDNLQVPPADLDVAASRRHEPEHWRRWRKQGDNYQYEKDGQWQAYDATPVRPGKAGEILAGTYTYSTSSGTLYTGSHVSFTYLTFGKDGSFSRSGYSSSASTNYIDSSTFANSDGVVSGVYEGFQDSGTVTVGSTGTGGKGEERPGHYKIDGYTIELTGPDGKTERKLFFFWADDKNISVGGTTYSREDK